MNCIYYPTFLLYILLIAVSILSIIIFLIIVIIRAVKQKTLKVPIIIFLATIVCISIIAGSVAFSDYQKDKWFYDLKSQIKKEYPVVNHIECDITTPSPTLSLFIYCNKTADKDNIDTIFQTINKYLFNNTSGSNPSQQSWLKRGQGLYTQIYISFYTDNTDKAEVTYFASYYTDGYSNKIDNFTTWHIEKKDEVSQ